MGRPPKPTALKVLHGDFDKNPQRRNHSEPQLPPSVPRCPATLKGEARKEWKRITEELSTMKVLTEVDRAAVQQYAEIWGMWHAALLMVRREGAVHQTEHGMYEHPASKMVSRYADQIHKYLCQFGLTPASRSRVNVQAKTEPMRMRRTR